MKIICPDCNSAVNIDETAYSTGEIATGFCPRCGAVVKAMVEHGGKDLPVKKEQKLQQSTQYQEAEVVPQPQQPTIDHALKKAELELKARELELREKEMKHSHEQAQNIVYAAQQAQQAAQQAQQAANFASQQYSKPYGVPEAAKSKTTAGILGILLGGIGAHHFYLGNTGRGIVYLLFCWTYIPAIIGLVEGISYLTKSDADFASKYPKY